MKTYLDCYACFLRQTIDAVRFAGADAQQEVNILKEVLQILHDTDPASKPPEISNHIHQIIRNRLDNPDPYFAVKKSSTAEAMAMLPWLQEKIRASKDQFETALRISVAGNIIDFGASREFNLHQVLEAAISEPFAIFDLDRMRETMSEAEWVLFIADNAGETVFDRLLINQINQPVYYAVKSSPIINDATLVDAIEANINSVATIVETGSNAPGTNLNKSSPQFRRLYKEASVIIAKGQGNYEMLSENGPRFFFLLKAKCQMVARDLGVSLGSFVVKQG